MTFCEAFASAKSKISAGRFYNGEENKFRMLINTSHLNCSEAFTHKCTKFMSKKCSDAKFIDLTPTPMFNILPATQDCFLGRNKEMFEIIDLIHYNRYITLKGAIGIGKSSLVKELANKMIDREMFEHGIIYIDLKTDVTIERLLSVISNDAAIGTLVRKRSANKEFDLGNTVIELAKVLQEHELLVILDNIDNVYMKSRNQFKQMVETILNHAPRVKILVTLFSPFYAMQSTFAEQVYELGPLTDHFAAQLLLKRATRRIPESEIVQLFATYPFDSHTSGKVRLESHPLIKALSGMPQVILMAASILHNRTLAEIYSLLVRKDTPHQLQYLMKEAGSHHLINSSVNLALDILDEIGETENLLPVTYFPAGILETDLKEFWGEDFNEHVKRLMSFSVMQRNSCKDDTVYFTINGLLLDNLMVMANSKYEHVIPSHLMQIFTEKAEKYTKGVGNIMPKKETNMLAFEETNIKAFYIRIKEMYKINKWIPEEQSPATQTQVLKQVSIPVHKRKPSVPTLIPQKEDIVVSSHGQKKRQIPETRKRPSVIKVGKESSLPVSTTQPRKHSQTRHASKNHPGTSMSQALTNSMSSLNSQYTATEKPIKEGADRLFHARKSTAEVVDKQRSNATQASKNQPSSSSNSRSKVPKGSTAPQTPKATARELPKHEDDRILEEPKLSKSASKSKSFQESVIDEMTKDIGIAELMEDTMLTEMEMEPVKEIEEEFEQNSCSSFTDERPSIGTTERQSTISNRIAEAVLEPIDEMDTTIEHISYSQVTQNSDELPSIINSMVKNSCGVQESGSVKDLKEVQEELKKLILDKNMVSSGQSTSRSKIGKEALPGRKGSAHDLEDHATKKYEGYGGKFMLMYCTMLILLRRHKEASRELNFLLQVGMHHDDVMLIAEVCRLKSIILVLDKKTVPSAVIFLELYLQYSEKVVKSTFSQAICHFGLGHCRLMMDKFETARRDLEDASRRYKRLEHNFGEQICLKYLVKLNTKDKRFQDAKKFQESLDILKTKMVSKGFINNHKHNRGSFIRRTQGEFCSLMIEWPMDEPIDGNEDMREIREVKGYRSKAFLQFATPILQEYLKKEESNRLLYK